MTELAPKLVSRPEQSYVGIRRRVAQHELGKELGPHLGELYAWLASRNVAPSGPPFFRYHVVDTAERLEVEAALPVSAAIDGDGRVAVGVLPAGRYLVALHTGPYEGLQASTAWLKAWALERSIELDTSEDDTRWKGRIETYLTDPSKELDPSRWVTELAILTVSEGVPTPTANHPH